MKTLGLVGLGAFGQIAAKYLCPFFDIKAIDVDPRAQRVAAHYNLRLAPLTECAQSKFIILAVPVSALESVARKIAPHLLPGTILLDVGSVKVKPAEILQSIIPKGVDLICTHPLFGPQSVLEGLKDHKIVICPVRSYRVNRVCKFLELVLKLKVYVSTPEEHDREMATVQGLTHLIARVLANIDPAPMQYTTRSFEHLMKAVDMVRNDSEELFQAIEGQNPYARDLRDRFFEGTERVKLSLARGNNILRAEIGLRSEAPKSYASRTG